MVAVVADQAVLQLGSFNLWNPPFVYADLTSSRPNYGSASSCGSILESTDLTFQVYITGLCAMSEAEAMLGEIQTELAKAPNLTFLQRATPTATLYSNAVKKGTIAFNDSELHARFTDRNTLSLILSLTILPDGAGNASGGNAAFLQTPYLAARGLLNWETDDIRFLLVDALSTAPTELYVPLMNGFVDLSEVATTGYARVPVDDRDVALGSSVQLLLTDPTFVAFDSGSEQVVAGIVYQHNGADSANVPLFLVQSFPPFLGGGAAHTIHIDLTGLF